MKTWVKWTLIWLWSVTILTWAWAWATKLWYIPNYLGIEALCPWHHVEIDPNVNPYEEYAKQWAVHPDENKDTKKNYYENLEEEYFEDIDTGSYYFEDLETDHSGVTTTKENTTAYDHWDSNNERTSHSNWSFAQPVAKPIIYLYPETTTEVTVKLWNPTQVTHSYPKYPETWWNIIANPDGSLIDTSSNRKLYALYWEGINNKANDITEWFVVKWEDAISFLEEKLAILWLDEREAEEFIVYWLPELENNTWNLIRFMTLDEINGIMPLDITPRPDSIIRIVMQYKPLDEYKEIPEQTLTTPERIGFSVVEWWGEKYSVIK